MRNMLLVGSIPYDTPKEVFESFGRQLGTHLEAMPDGEVGPRAHWASRVHYQVFAGHPDLEIVGRPRPDNGIERLNPHDDTDRWTFRVKENIDVVRFGNPGWRLGFARDAVNSYFVFQVMKEKGILPQHLRFQVSLPMVNSVLPPRVLPVKGDIERFRPGYEAALKSEVEKIVEKIPAEELAIQWDCSTEIQDVYGGVPDLPYETRIERNVSQVRNLSPSIPEGVMLGYHLCFGTLGGWPRFSPSDLGETVRLANAIHEASGRRVDWIHIPTLNTIDEKFYAPLAGLKAPGTKIYLGMIHNMDTFADRVSVAKRYVADFGIAAFCGFGRMSPTELGRVLDDHIQAAKLSG